jgi:hypothetical protein
LQFAVTHGRSSPFLAGAAIVSCDHSALAKPAFVQANNGAQLSSQTIATIPYLRAQMAGDLNVVIVQWKDTAAQIRSVTDTTGNSYQLAVGPTMFNGIASQSIYYAKNIVPSPGGVNMVTVKFTTARRVIGRQDLRVQWNWSPESAGQSRRRHRQRNDDQLEVDNDEKWNGSSAGPTMCKPERPDPALDSPAGCLPDRTMILPRIG